ncbi:MAG: DNA repair protein RecO [Patescibacteria group bacterium]
MANGLYKTEGFILSSREAGEAEKMVSVFTKEFGLLRLFARGARRPRSKLNPYLNIFTHGRLGFVSGRDRWHLVDAEDVLHFDDALQDREKLELLGRAANFVERFHKGESKDEVFWHIILSFVKFLDRASSAMLGELELLFYAKALFVLGYLDEEKLFSRLPPEERAWAERVLEDNEFDEWFFPLPAVLKKELEGDIARGTELAKL